MIFVTLGTQDKPFSRLLEAIEKLEVNTEIVAQTGSTKFVSDKIKIIETMDKETYEKYMKSADIIISHAGIGSILTGLKYEKKMIVVAREKKYKEHVNDHQKQILEIFSKMGYILGLEELENLDEYIKKEFKPKKYISNNKKFQEKLYDIIENL